MCNTVTRGLLLLQALLQSKQHNWLPDTSQEVRPYRSLAGSATVKNQNCKTVVRTRVEQCCLKDKLKEVCTGKTRRTC